MATNWTMREMQPIWPMLLNNLKKLTLFPPQYWLKKMPQSRVVSKKKNLMDLIIVSKHTTCNTQPFEASNNNYISWILYKFHIIVERERERERDSHLQRMFMCYTAKKLSVVGKCYKTKTYIKNLGIVINSC